MMQDYFAEPSIPAPQSAERAICPRRLLNETNYLKDMTDTAEAPLTGAKKMRLRYAANPTVMVNDAGMVRNASIKGMPF